MADEQTGETQTESGSKAEDTAGKGDVEQKQEEQKQEAAKEPDFKAQLDRMVQENEELKGLVKGAVKRASEAEGFVSTLTGKLSEIAERRQAPAADDGVDPRERLRERMNEDPAGVLEEHYQARTGPLVRGFLDQQGKMNRELFVTKTNMTEEGREILKDYLEEVDDFLKDFGPEHRASPDAYDAALRWVLSKPDNFNKEIERRVKKEREKEKVHFVEPGTAGERAPKESRRELSTIEKEVATGLGLSEEEYVKYKEG